jgi:hypothetical protein
LIDREQGANKVAQTNGMSLRSLTKFKTEGVNWLKDRMAQKEYETVIDYLKDDQTYQNKALQDELKRVALAK